jgi:hypothetical protein
VVARLAFGGLAYVLAWGGTAAWGPSSRLLLPPLSSPFERLLQRGSSTRAAAQLFGASMAPAGSKMQVMTCRSISSWFKPDDMPEPAPVALDLGLRGPIATDEPLLPCGMCDRKFKSPQGVASHHGRMHAPLIEQAGKLAIAEAMLLSCNEEDTAAWDAERTRLQSVVVGLRAAELANAEPPAGAAPRREDGKGNQRGRDTRHRYRYDEKVRALVSPAALSHVRSNPPALFRGNALCAYTHPPPPPHTHAHSSIQLPLYVLQAPRAL